MANIINSPNMYRITNLKISINDTTNNNLLIHVIGFPSSFCELSQRFLRNACRAFMKKFQYSTSLSLF